MQLLVDDLWPELLRRCRLAKRRRAAIAYVSELSSVEFRDGDLLITDASDSVIKSGGTSAAVLADLKGRGVELFSYPFLHAKVWIFDSTAIVGSANASSRSQNGLLEAGILTNDVRLVSAAQALIETLRRQAIKLTEAEISRLMLLPVCPGLAPKGKSKPLGLKFGKSTWITSGGEIEVSLATRKQQVDGRRNAREVAASPASRIDRMEFEENAYLNDRLRRGDQVIWIWTDSESGKPVEVEKPVPIVFDQKVRRGRLFWYEQKRSDAARTLSWQQFKKLAKHCGIKNLLRERRFVASEIKKLDASWDDFVK